jgi:putative lipoprotein
MTLAVLPERNRGRLPEKLMRTLVTLAATVAIACGGNKKAETAGPPAGTDMAAVTGTVFYLERMALPSGAVLTVQLVDVSIADAPAVVIARETKTLTTQVPIPFSLSYDPKKIIQLHSYAVQARIEVDGKLRFINTTSNPVITNGKPTTVDIRVSPVP